VKETALLRLEPAWHSRCGAADLFGAGAGDAPLRAAAVLIAQPLGGTGSATEKGLSSG